MVRWALRLGAVVMICILCLGCGDDVTKPGAVVCNIYNRVAPEGETVLLWGQKAGDGASVPSGTYGVRMTTLGYDSTAVFRIVTDEANPRLPSRASGFLSGFDVWTGSEAYVVGESVDVHFSVPEPAEVEITIIKQ